MAVTGAIFPKQYANAINRHEKNEKILSNATSVGDKLKLTEDINKMFIYNIVSIVSSPSKKSDIKKFTQLRI